MSLYYPSKMSLPSRTVFLKGSDASAECMLCCGALHIVAKFGGKYKRKCVEDTNLGQDSVNCDYSKLEVKTSNIMSAH